MSIIKNQFKDGYYVEDINIYLKENGLFLEKQDSISNNLKFFMTQAGIGVCDLEKLTGIFKQSINEILKENTVPSVINAQKLAYVLNCSIEELFPLKSDHWKKQATDMIGKTLYYSIVEKKIYNSVGKKKAISQGKYEYFDNENAIFLTKESVKKTMDSKAQEIYQGFIKNQLFPGYTENQLKVEAVLQANFLNNSQNIKVYYALYKKIEPYKLIRKNIW